MTDDSPLTGLRVLDFSRLLPGPYCTLLLGSLGAEIIKVEDTRTGDGLRDRPPFVVGVGATFSFLNGGKQSVALDLKNSAGRAVAQELAAISDVVVEGFRPGVAARLGVDFATLSARNDRLVYCSISGFGQTGALRDLPGHDLTYAALSGLLEALFPGTPRVPGVQLVDAAAALLACIRVLAALRAVEAGPQYLDVALVDAAQSLMPVAIAEEAAGQEPSTLALLRGSVRNNLYRCADGRWLAVTPLEEPFWERLCAVLRAEDLLGPHDVPTDEMLRRAFSCHSVEEWFARLSEGGVPSAPVLGVTEAVRQRAGGELLGIVACDHSARANGPHLRAPALGEDTARWLAALGYSEDEIRTLDAKGAVRCQSGGLASSGG